MFGTLMLAQTWLPTLPSFDWTAAYVVGAIVAIGAVLVLWMAIATPFVAIEGRKFLGTTFAVLCLGAATGAIAAAAAGFYWGRQGDVKRAEIVQLVTKVSNQLDIFFDADPASTGQAKSFRATFVSYDEDGLDTKAPGVRTVKKPIVGPDADAFYAQAADELKAWAAKRTSTDGKPPRVHVFMKPYPGDGVLLKLKDFCREHGCVIETTDSEWVSALNR